MIYFIKEPTQGFIKIGYTQDIDKRFPQIQSGNPYELSIIRIIQNGNREIEKKLHGHFKDLHVTGEWFKFTEEMLVISENELTIPFINPLNIQKGIKKKRLNYLTNRALDELNNRIKYENVFVTVSYLAKSLDISTYMMNEYCSAEVLKTIDRINYDLYGTVKSDEFKKYFKISKKFHPSAKATEMCENTGVATPEYTKIRRVLSKKITNYQKINEEKLDLAFR